MPDELTFTNERNTSNFNFDYFLEIEDSVDRCEELQYYIEKSCDNGITYEPCWFGYFAINDGNFDLDRCIFRSKIKVDDEEYYLVKESEILAIINK